MATLAGNKPRDYELADINELPVIATDVIYEGAAVGDNGNGYARPLVAGDPFRGFAESKADNISGSAGDITVRVRTKGKAVLSISGLAITDVGKDVYASDDDTFSLTQGANTRIGHVYRYVESGKGIVEFDANKGVSEEITDSSGGTASATIAAIGSSYVQATVADAFATLTAKVNYLLRQMGQ